MTRRSRFMSMLLFCAVAVGSWQVQPVTAAMVELTLEELAAGSPDIINGEVLSKESQWNEDSTFIFTSVTIRVTDLHKGSLSPSNTITVMTPGGEVGETGLGVEHAPRFEVGQEVIVFLTPVRELTYSVTGWEQGKYTVEDGQVKEKSKSVSSFEEEIREALK
jgi:hypothetical protein